MTECNTFSAPPPTSTSSSFPSPTLPPKTKRCCLCTTGSCQTCICCKNKKTCCTNCKPMSRGKCQNQRGHPIRHNSRDEDTEHPRGWFSFFGRRRNTTTSTAPPLGPIPTFSSRAPTPSPDPRQPIPNSSFLGDIHSLPSSTASLASSSYPVHTLFQSETPEETVVTPQLHSSPFGFNLPPLPESPPVGLLS